MILALTLEYQWMILAAVYQLLAVPLVFIISLLIFFRLGPLGTLTSPRFAAAFIPLAILNLGLTLFFVFGLSQPVESEEPGLSPALIDWAWLAAVGCSPIFLIISSLRGGGVKTRESSGAKS